MSRHSHAVTYQTRQKNAKMHRVMSEFAHHTLRSGGGNHPIVTNRKQAVAIGLSEVRHHLETDGRRRARHQQRIW